VIFSEIARFFSLFQKNRKITYTFSIMLDKREMSKAYEPGEHEDKIYAAWLERLEEERPIY
jgi:hypothetical protein